MTKLELSTNELSILKDLLEVDMEQPSWGDVDYADVNLMQYYLDRATVLVKIQKELGL